MNGNITIAVAFAAGIVSFASPCCLPMVPAYVSYIVGGNPADARPARRTAFEQALAFVLGFTVVFVILGAAVGGMRTWLLVNKQALDIGLGIFSIVLGLAFIGVFSRAVPWLHRDLRIHKVPAVGLAAAPVLGFFFGLGWTPCIGPTLGVILGLGYDEGTAGRAAVLLGFYSLGLGVPFVLAGVAWRRALTAVAFVRRHQQWVTRAGGGMLVLVGVLLVTGLWDQAVTWIQVQLVSDFEVAV